MENGLPDITIGPQPGPQEAFFASPADFVLYGGQAGSGKSFGLLVEAARSFNIPGYEAAIFRRTSTQITAPGGLWSEAGKIYNLLGGIPRESHPKSYTWPGGGVVSFHHLQHEKNKFDWQGSQMAFLGFDELPHFSESQFFYMMSRNRSTCGVKPYVRATCNPDPDSWVAKLVEWWIGEDGFPIKERSGVIRWFYRVEDTLYWYDSAEEAKAAWPQLADIAEPTSFTFIPASIYDNPALLSKDPGYLAKLLTLPFVERSRLLGGNWKIRHEAGNVFRATWFGIYKAIPSGITRWVRCWDMASTQDGGDWTVGALLGWHPDGRTIIADVRRGQWSPGERDKQILLAARADGNKIPIRWEEEPGSAGKTVSVYMKKLLRGYDAKGKRATGSKVVRAGPLSAQAEAGNVWLVDSGRWDVTGFLDRVKAFPTPDIPDDEVDSIAAAFNVLARTPSKTKVR